jgi:Sulfotransferase domain
MSEKTLPNLIVAGVNKAGTTSLFTYLGQHPQAGASAVKETCHFLPLRYGEPMPAIEDYRAQFTRVADKPVRFESTPGYFYGGRPLIDGLRDALGEELRIILIFREPVGRLVSFFNFKKSTLELPAGLTLGDYVGRCRAMEASALRERANNPWFGLEGGKYADYLPPWVEAFGGRLRIVFAEDLKRDPRGVLRGVFEFVGVDPDQADRIDLSIENKGTDYRSAGAQRLALALNRAGERFWRSHPKVKQSLRRMYYALNGRAFLAEDDPDVLDGLRRFYEPYNERLAEQLRNLGHETLPGWLTEQRPGAAGVTA